MVREGQLPRQEWIEQEEERIGAIERGTFEREKINTVLERLGLQDYYQACVDKWR